MSESQRFFEQLLRDRNYETGPILYPPIPMLERVVLDRTKTTKEVYFKVNREDGTEIFEKQGDLVYRVICT